MMTWKTVLLILSLVCFALVAFKVEWKALSLLGAGLFFFVATFINISASRKE